VPLLPNHRAPLQKLAEELGLLQSVAAPR